MGDDTSRNPSEDMAEHPRTDQTITEPRAKLLDLSPIQLIGGSMAAATAAALGSRLGVVGTIAGAAVGSVVTAIAASLYTNSMARAHQVIITTWRPGVKGAPVVAVEPVPRGEGSATTAQPGPSRERRTRRAWLAPVVSAAAVFALAAAFLTGFQLATGASVTGTSVGTRPGAAHPADVAKGGPAGSAPRAPADPSPSTASQPTASTSIAGGTGTPSPTTDTATPAPVAPSGTADTTATQTQTAPVTPAPTG